MSRPVIEFDHFSFQYDAQAEPTLRDVCLTIFEGEKVLIAGPSGCGKSTLAHCLNGLIPFAYPGKATGSLRVMGRETREMGIFELSKIVGTVLQDTDGQFIGLTVAEDIAFALENDVTPLPEMRRRVLEASELVGVQAHLAHAPHELSGGQKQRVTLAGVMVDDVKILLFDEPLANLDPATGRQAVELIDAIQKRSGATVVMIEHRLEDALNRPADRVILLDDGRVVCDLPPDELVCGEHLAKIGLREPLYATALKYAGLTIHAGMRAGSAATLALSEAETEAVRRWFLGAPEAPKDPAPKPLLATENLSFQYPNGLKALEGINLTVGEGEMMAIVGCNGAGKSTFAKLLCGFEKPAGGVIRFRGRDVRGDSVKARADHIGYVMQNPNQMISHAMIRDEVASGLVARGLGPDEIARRVEEALATCGLSPFRAWPVSALSYGQKKRLTIASILALEPDVLILDEPTAGQDFRNYTRIMEFLRELNARGIAIVMITHDMHLMLEYCPRAAVFAGGKLIADDTGAGILTDPETVRAASLRETSLYALSIQCGIPDARSFAQRFIDHDREVRA